MVQCPASTKRRLSYVRSTHTPARPGDRIVFDALASWCAVLLSNSSLEDAVKAGAGKTRGMKAQLLRTDIVCGGGEGRIGIPPDPGAWGVANLVVGFQKLLQVKHIYGPPVRDNDLML
ncbi:hypothetical protein EDD22DRAFT_475450 [Suillus occidentalis]|nr:hypothetical protein EDD22DRAFT_475450 [Suillus occidentalis]